MNAIPLHDFDEVATKGDLRATKADLRAEIAELRVDMINEIGALRKTMTNWMLTVLVTVVGAMAGIAFIA